MALAAANPTQGGHQPNHTNPDQSTEKANEENLIACAQQHPDPHERPSTDDTPAPKRIRLEPEKEVDQQDQETIDYLTQENLPPSMEKCNNTSPLYLHFIT
jgi:hypothetical protein